MFLINHIISICVIITVLIVIITGPVSSVDWDSCQEPRQGTFCMGVQKTGTENATAYPAGHGCLVTRDCLAVIIGQYNGRPLNANVVVEWQLFNHRSRFVDSRSRSSRVVWYVHHYHQVGLWPSGRRQIGMSKTILFGENVQTRGYNPQKDFEFCEYVERFLPVEGCNQLQTNGPLVSYRFVDMGVDVQDTNYIVARFTSSMTLHEPMRRIYGVPKQADYQVNFAMAARPRLFREEFTSDMAGHNNVGPNKGDSEPVAILQGGLDSPVDMFGLENPGIPFDKCFDNSPGLFCWGHYTNSGGVSEPGCLFSMDCQVTVIAEVVLENGQDVINWDMWVMADRTREDGASETNRFTSWTASERQVANIDGPSFTVMAMLDFDVPQGQSPKFCAFYDDGSRPDCITDDDDVYKMNSDVRLVYDLSSALNFWHVRFTSKTRIMVKDEDGKIVLPSFVDFTVDTNVAVTTRATLVNSEPRIIGTFSSPQDFFKYNDDESTTTPTTTTPTTTTTSWLRLLMPETSRTTGTSTSRPAVTSDTTSDVTSETTKPQKNLRQRGRNDSIVGLAVFVLFLIMIFAIFLFACIFFIARRRKEKQKNNLATEHTYKSAKEIESTDL